MEERNSTPVDAILFFDESAPKLAECTRKCSKRQNVACKHRLRFSAEIIYTDNSYSGLPKGYSDYKLIHCVFDIIKKRKFGRDGRFKKAIKIFVTLDRNFFESVRVEALKEKDNSLTFDDQRRVVSRGAEPVFIFWVKFRPKTTLSPKRHFLIKSLIQYMNFLQASF